MMDTCYDQLDRRCPRLGGTITFEYCRTGAAEKTPCYKIFDCWWERFDVVGFLQAGLAPEVFEDLCQSRPKPKLASILELVEQAKKQSDG